MALGMCNAPATFLQLVNTVLADLVNCNTYLAELIVYTATLEEHLAILEQMLKIEFGKATVTYIGQQVHQSQVWPVEAKISAITVWFPLPTKTLYSFFGMAGHYRSFCQNFSSIVHPLTTLLSSKVNLVSTPKCKHAFENVKSLLVQDPVLTAPELSKPFKLEVDASAVGASAIFLQECSNGVEHPVCYFSGKFNKHQSNYSTIEI